MFNEIDFFLEKLTEISSILKVSMSKLEKMKVIKE